MATKPRDKRVAFLELLELKLSAAQSVANDLLDNWPPDESLERQTFADIELALDSAQTECSDLVKEINKASVRP